MIVGDLVKEKYGGGNSRGKASLGIVLKVRVQSVKTSSWEKKPTKEMAYFIHFFDDHDKCWMREKFLVPLGVT